MKNYFISGADALDVYIRGALLGSLCICLPNAMVLPVIPVKRLEPYVKTKWFPAIHLQSI